MITTLKKIMTVLVLLATVASLQAQTLSPQVSPSSGGYATAGSVKLSWTMGQTFNSTLTAGSSKLTQGFQQPEMQIYTGALSSGSYVQGSAVQVPYIAQGYYSASNVFTAQLSSSTGSFTSPVNIGTLTSTTSGTVSATIPLGTAVGTGYRIRVVSNASAFNGKDNGSDVAITSATNTWTGAVSTAWALPGNWTLAVPTSTTDGLIPTGLARYPIISTTASVANLTISSGASVMVSSGQTLQLFGNLSNSGTAALGAGTVALKGTTTFTGASAFANLTVAGNGTVGTGANDKISVSAKLTKLSGTLNTSNKLTLISTNLQTALIADSGGALTGTATIQRFIPGNTGYHEITSPLTGGTVASIGGFAITGTNGVAGYLVGQAGSLAEYRESTNIYNTLDSGYYNYTTPSNPLNSGQGFTAKVGGGVTISFTGNPSNGNLSYNITNLGSNIKTAGWNLIGNPYPSPVRWSFIKNANPGMMNATCYIWKPTTASTGAWQSYNGTYGTGGVGDLLGLGQGFFVLKTATGTSTLSFTNAIRTVDLSPVSYKSDVAPDEIRLTLTSGDVTAEALTYTEAGRTTGFDEDADGLLPEIDGMEATSVAFTSKDDKYLINVIDNINETLEMPLAIHTTDPGTYTISAASLNVNAYPVYLLDKSTNTYHEIATKDVTFNSAGNEDKTNYSVVFSKKASANAPGEVKVNIWGTTGAINVERSISGTPATIIVNDLIGREISRTTTSNSFISLPVEVSTIYLVREIESDKETVRKVLVK
jgi:hypothetical protein